MSKKKKYNCLKCPGYCCSYPRIAVSRKDIKRLALFFNMDFKKAENKFTKKYTYKEKNKKYVKETIIRHKKDSIYKSTCRFLDQETRNCKVYDARPNVCRVFPDEKKCGYYEFIKFERKQQGDKDFIPSC